MHSAARAHFLHFFTVTFIHIRISKFHKMSNGKTGFVPPVQLPRDTSRHPSWLTVLTPGLDRPRESWHGTRQPNLATSGASGERREKKKVLEMEVWKERREWTILDKVRNQVNFANKCLCRETDRLAIQLAGHETSQLAHQDWFQSAQGTPHTDSGVSFGPGTGGWNRCRCQKHKKAHDVRGVGAFSVQNLQLNHLI